MCPFVTPVLVLRRYVLFGLVSAEMEVGVKYLEILQAEVCMQSFRGATRGTV